MWRGFACLRKQIRKFSVQVHRAAKVLIKMKKKKIATDVRACSVLGLVPVADTVWLVGFHGAAYTQTQRILGRRQAQVESFMPASLNCSLLNVCNLQVLHH